MCLKQELTNLLSFLGNNPSPSMNSLQVFGRPESSQKSKSEYSSGYVKPTTQLFHYSKFTQLSLFDSLSSESILFSPITTCNPLIILKIPSEYFQVPKYIEGQQNMSLFPLNQRISIYFTEVHKFIPAKHGMPLSKCIYITEHATTADKSKIFHTLN